MNELDRRSLLKVFAAVSVAPYSALGNKQESAVHLVKAGADRTGQPHKAARADAICFHAGGAD